MEAPLAERIRPQLEDYISQAHLGPEGSLTQQIAKIIPSLIFWGPPPRVKQLWHKLLRRNRNALFLYWVLSTQA
jgi:replication-associated recombination protein RarA